MMADMDPSNFQIFGELDESMCFCSEEIVHLNKATSETNDNVNENDKDVVCNVEPDFQLFTDYNDVNSYNIDDVLQCDGLLDPTPVPGSQTKETEPCKNRVLDDPPMALDLPSDFLDTEKAIFSLHGIDINLPLTCDICDSVYADMEEFDLHMEKHMEYRFFTCQLCNKTYVSWQNLVAHRKANHHGQVLSCNMCSKRKYHANLGPVNYPVAGYPVGCEECSAGFDSVGELYRHYRMHTQDGQVLTPTASKEVSAKDSELSQLLSEYEAALEATLGTGLPRPSAAPLDLNGSLSSEALAEHKPQGLPAASSGQEDLTQTKRATWLPSCCSCQVSFANVPELQKHVQQTHSKNPNVQMTCASCGCSVTVQEFIAHYVACLASKGADKLPEKDSATCKQCQKILPDAAALKEHMLGHGNMRLEFICDVCGVCMPSYKELAEHTRTLCGQVALPVSGVLLEKSSRSGAEQQSQKTFVCEYCSRQFARKSLLRLHVKRHLGDKPHSCSQCSKSFYTVNQLNTHKGTHVKRAEHKCHKCKKSFATLLALKSHSKFHKKEKEFPCFRCDKTFFWYSAYVTHLRSHLDTLPLKCEFCFRSFTLESRLKMHRQRHLALRWANCQLPFANKESLDEHKSQGCPEGTERSESFQGQNTESPDAQEQAVRQCDKQVSAIHV